MATGVGVGRIGSVGAGVGVGGTSSLAVTSAGRIDGEATAAAAGAVEVAEGRPA